MTAKGLVAGSSAVAPSTRPRGSSSVIEGTETLDVFFAPTETVEGSPGARSAAAGLQDLLTSIPGTTADVTSTVAEASSGAALSAEVVAVLTMSPLSPGG